MEKVQRYLCGLLQVQRHGGRIVLRDEKTLIVYDTPSWSDREARALRSRFPECDVAVQASDASMSGFILIVTRHSEPWGVASESVFLLAMFSVFWAAWWLHGYLRQAESALNI